METKELDRIVASAELRNPKVFYTSRERYVAELSFKAGFKEALDTVVATREYDEGKQAGIKVVVDFTAREFGVEWDEEQLKEWGLK
uniref:Uncharacterized protein n=1 Tax=viral metagenome TaxID=1070528 RepID=A0A6H2A5V0_9ZZZZ